MSVGVWVRICSDIPLMFWKFKIAVNVLMEWNWSLSQAHAYTNVRDAVTPCPAEDAATSKRILPRICIWCVNTLKHTANSLTRGKTPTLISNSARVHKENVFSMQENHSASRTTTGCCMIRQLSSIEQSWANEEEQVCSLFVLFKSIMKIYFELTSKMLSLCTISPFSFKLTNSQNRQKSRLNFVGK